eukprot:gnl/TRDRNA2_/TRDRNA2_200016_c0_seq1.p1 gnl/TRDRNA2_/TRDRNA2_200016_c0~~gnl/TRDRNA2_/TRDRNA2_200016_c0_seq1.p1  ORF type:complete len:249 (+),score=42.25 gnl/TRDRNA2_/TRDRNA2_200016_c0_seq1:61-807(+)
MAASSDSPKQPTAMRPGDWCCPACGNHNYANKVACNMCSIPKMAAMGMVFGKGGGFGMKGGFAGAKGAFAMKGGSGKGTKLAGGDSTAILRPGDWCCASCGNHNYASRAVCNMCGSSPAGSKSAGTKGPMMEEMRPGDWVCFVCKNHNYARRDTCNKCEIPKSTYIAKSGMRPGDWLCPACQNHNYANRPACNKCQTPKQSSVVHTKNMRQGDWLCSQCGNHNYSDKVNCNKCRMSKAMAAATTFLSA